MPAIYCVVYITAPSTSAKRIARKLVQMRLAACINIIPGVTSVYRWKGQLNEDHEALLILKTRKAMLTKLFQTVKKNHPYSLPEIIALPIIKGDPLYLDWIHDETK